MPTWKVKNEEENKKNFRKNWSKFENRVRKLELLPTQDSEAGYCLEDFFLNSGVARAFPGGQIAHLEGQNEEENFKNLTKKILVTI